MSASGLVMKFITKCELMMGEKTRSCLASILRFSIPREAHTRFIVIYKFRIGMGSSYAG